MDFAGSVQNYVRAGYQALTVNTSEVGRCESELFRLCELGACEAVLTWDCVGGFIIREVAQSLDVLRRLYPPPTRSTKPEAHEKWLTQRLEQLQQLRGTQVTVKEKVITDPIAAVNFLLKGMSLHQVVVVMRNLHVFMKEPVLGQLWQTAIHDGDFNCMSESGELRCRLPVIVGTGVSLPASLQSTVTPIDFQLPGLKDMQNIFNLIEEAAAADRARLGKPPMPASPALGDQICRGLLGLTLSEAKNTLSLCGVRCGSLGTEEVLATIEAEKSLIIRKNSALTYVSRNQIGSEDDVGGFAEFKKWLLRRKLCYSRRAEELGLDRPRGVVLLGIRGTGKSLVAKTSAKILGLPLVVMNMGGLFGSLVGQSESQTDDTLRTIDALNGSVVLIDEADKALQGSSGATTDSGVSQRIFGKLLTWLAEKKNDTFVIMTMNTMKNIPTELFRRGRFDEVFYVDLPDEDERREILQIHLRQRGLDPQQILPTAADWEPLLKVTTQFVGAELEYVVAEARLAAFAARDSGEPTPQELLDAASTVVTTAQLDPVGLTEIRDFCKERARPVHATLPPQSKQPRQPRVSTSRNANN